MNSKNIYKIFNIEYNKNSIDDEIKNFLKENSGKDHSNLCRELNMPISAEISKIFKKPLWSKDYGFWIYEGKSLSFYKDDTKTSILFFPVSGDCSKTLLSVYDSIGEKVIDFYINEVTLVNAKVQIQFDNSNCNDAIWYCLEFNHLTLSETIKEINSSLEINYEDGNNQNKQN